MPLLYSYFISFVKLDGRDVYIMLDLLFMLRYNCKFVKITPIGNINEWLVYREILFLYMVMTRLTGSFFSTQSHS